jgi:hypothetical protein
VGTNTTRATPFAGFAFCCAALIAPSGAWAGECSQATPECHLTNGRKLLDSDPKRAAQELLASYRLDERTDTLTLYATALASDKQYARALETWQRIIIFRESEIEAAKEAMRVPSVKKREAARKQMARAQDESEQAAAEIMKLWPSVARVRIVMPAGLSIVTANGIEVDPSRDVLVNAGRDELTFTRPDGSRDTIAIEIAAGQVKTIQAPQPRATEPAPVVLQPRAAPPAEKPAPVVITRAPAPSLSMSRSVEEPRSRTLSRVGLGLAAGGVVTLGVAGTLAYLGNRDFDDARSLGCSSNGDCPLGPASERGDRAHDRTRYAQITAIGGGALFVTGATMWLLGRRTERRTPTDVTLSVGPSSVGIGWSLK